MQRIRNLECADNGGALDLLIGSLIQSGVTLRLPPHSKLLVIFLLFGLTFFGCAEKRPLSTAPSNELIVSAAASLKDAFSEIAELNEKRNGTKVRFNFGASGVLQKQIESGAPVDVFASAGTKQMNELGQQSLIVPATRRDFAQNSLVLIVPAQSQLIHSFTDLSKPAVKKIAAGNPKTVPAGIYTEQTLTKLKLLPEISPRLIFAEDVRQVLDYVVRDEVDAGFVYATDAQSAGGKVRVISEAPADTHDPILYPIAVVAESNHEAAARKFIDVVMSAEGQLILYRHGFVIHR
jgi:molybdate transport system substrate-binding protein